MNSRKLAYLFHARPTDFVELASEQNNGGAFCSTYLRQLTRHHERKMNKRFKLQSYLLGNLLQTGNQRAASAC